MSHLPGDTFSGYLLQRLVANGAFCRVYEAVNPQNGSVCAIKIGKPTDYFDGEPTKLWGAPTKEHHTKAEVVISGGISGVTLSSADVLAKQAAHLRSWNDPGVVHLHDHVIREEMPYLCLEYLPGLTLRQLIRGKQANLKTLVEILEALERLAARSSIRYHGDLKPENIIVTTTGAKMIDPGYFGELSGAKDVAITTRAYYPRLQPDDLFACGLILWETTLSYHPLLDRCTEFDSKTIGPKFEEAMRDNRFGIERNFLEKLSMVTRPSLVNREITPTTEDFLLKAIGLRRLADGRIDLGDGFKGFREMKEAMIQQKQGLSSPMEIPVTLSKGLINLRNHVQPPLPA
jgi:serine/threonine protein kinase